MGVFNHTQNKQPLDGGIASFFCYKEIKMTDEDTKLHHKVFCENWYKIDHDPITI